MADGTNTSGNDTPVAPIVSDGTPAATPVPASNSQNDNSAQPAASTQSHDTPGGQGFDLTKLTDRIDALPESIANAVKELIPQTAPVTPNNAQASDNSTNNAGSGSVDNGGHGNSAVSASTDSGGTSHPRHVRFANWWFGK